MRGFGYFGGALRTSPAMPTIPVQDYGHRSHELPLSGFAASPSTMPKGVVFDLAEWPQPSRLPALVTKLLER